MGWFCIHLLRPVDFLKSLCGAGREVRLYLFVSMCDDHSAGRVRATLGPPDGSGFHTTAGACVLVFWDS